MNLDELSDMITEQFGWLNKYGDEPDSQGTMYDINSNYVTVYYVSQRATNGTCWNEATRYDYDHWNTYSYPELEEFLKDKFGDKIEIDFDLDERYVDGYYGNYERSNVVKFDIENFYNKNKDIIENVVVEKPAI